MEKNYVAEFEFVDGIDNDNKPDFDKVNKLGNVEVELPERVQKEIRDGIESDDINKTLLALEQSGHPYSIMRQGETTKIFIQDKELEQIRVINFEVKDEVERSEEIVPELSEEERKGLARRIQEKKISKEEIREQYGEHLEDRDIDEEIVRNTISYNEEIRLNQMLFEAPDINAINDVLVSHGLEKVPEDRPYIIEHKDGYETGMKIVFGQETRVINEIATEEEKQAILSCRDIAEVDRVIKHTTISREDKRGQERTDDEDYRRDVEGADFSATKRNRTYEYDRS